MSVRLLDFKGIQPKGSDKHFYLNLVNTGLHIHKSAYPSFRVNIATY